MNLEKGDVVEVTGELKKVVDFLSSANKETIRILASFFSGDSKGVIDAKKLKKPLKVTNFYQREDVVEVAISKTDVWEEKADMFKKVVVEPEVENVKEEIKSESI